MIGANLSRVLPACQQGTLLSDREIGSALKEFATWRGNRSDAGRVRPDRFLTNNKFSSVMVGGNGKNGGKD